MADIQDLNETLLRVQNNSRTIKKGATSNLAGLYVIIPSYLFYKQLHLLGQDPYDGGYQL